MIRFAIITVCYNALHGLEKTMQSVFAQQYQQIDYLVVDGGSNDGSAELIEKNAARLAYWVSEPDKGIYDAMNKGIAQVQAMTAADGIDRYVLMLNADDTLFAPDTLQQVAAFIAQQPQAPDVVCGGWMIHPEHGAYKQVPGALEQLPRRYVICHQATFVKGSVLAANLFDERYRLAGDFHQLSRLYMKGYRFVCCPDIVVSDMVLNEGATERNWRASVHEGFDVVRENGCYRCGQESWLVLRKRAVRLIKRLLPSAVSDKFFGWLARHYKAM